ncbi:MAG: C10 family peptidase [Bacteroidaceae bacterium]|nr:C10 family peptidase [Bacteroidaceae bacterium]
MRFLKTLILPAVLAVTGMINTSAQQRTTEDIMRIVAQSPVGSVAKSRSFNNAPQTLQPQPYYVFSGGKDGGFVIVSGDERMTPVLAYSTSGDFCADSLPDNVKAWMEMYAQEYEALSQGIAPAKPESAKARKLDNPDKTIYPGETELPDSVAPFMLSLWGQYAPYNDLCPVYNTTGDKAATGCGATAMAQCMYYYRYPERGVGAYGYTTKTYGFKLSWDFGGHPLMWDNMRDTYESSTTYSDDEMKAISELLYGCGVAVNMDYDEESGSFHRDVMAALHERYHYDEDMALIKRNRMTEEAWNAALMAELNSRRPILLSAQSKQGGHMFITHGYKLGTDGTPAYYMNWGWRGRYDGYYTMPNLCYDGVADHTLSGDISGIVGIQPDNGISNMENCLFVKTIELEKSYMNLGDNRSLLFTVRDLYNASLKNFNGDVMVYLRDAEGNKTLFFNAAQEIPFSYIYSFNYRRDVPSSLESGVYDVICCVRNAGSDIETEVPMVIPVRLTIRNEAADFKPQLAAAEVTVEKTGDRELALHASNVMNAREEIFDGTMQMLLTDIKDYPVAQFGNTVEVNNLPQYSYFARTDNYSGELPTDLPDGAYRLHLGANQTGYVGWGVVKKYVIEGGYLTDLDIDAYTPIWVVDGIVTLDAPQPTLTFRLDGEIISQTTVTMGDSITAPEHPTKEGYTFSGWGVVPPVMPATDVTVDGSFLINRYNAIFRAENGTLVSEYSHEYGQPITLPEAPAKYGHTFTGWAEKVGEEWVMVNEGLPMPARDLELITQYRPTKYAVVYMLDYEQYDVDSVAYGGTITLRDAPADREGYTFSGWSTPPESMPAKDVIINGRFKINNYYITYLNNDIQWGKQQYAYGAEITLPTSTPSKTGYTFIGWGEKVGEEWSIIEAGMNMPAHDMELTAQFKVNTYAVVYTVDGEEYHTDSIDYGAAVTTLDPPTKEGYTFSGWNKALPETMPARDLAISGTFRINYYYLTYMTDGVQWGKQQLKYGSSITPPSREPSKKGHTFKGWGEQVDEEWIMLTAESTVPAHDVVYDAIFEVNKYQLILMMDGQPYKTIVLDYGEEIVPETEDEDYYYEWQNAPTTMPDHDVTINVVITAVGGYRISDIRAGDSLHGVMIYSADGKRLNTLRKGINILRTPDGKSCKIVVR